MSASGKLSAVSIQLSARTRRDKKPPNVLKRGGYRNLECGSHAPTFGRRSIASPAKPDRRRFVHYGYILCGFCPTLKRRAQRTKPGNPGSQGASAPFAT